MPQGTNVTKAHLLDNSHHVTHCSSFLFFCFSYVPGSQFSVKYFDIELNAEMLREVYIFFKIFIVSIFHVLQSNRVRLLCEDRFFFQPKCTCSDQQVNWVWRVLCNGCTGLFGFIQSWHYIDCIPGNIHTIHKKNKPQSGTDTGYRATCAQTRQKMSMKHEQAISKTSHMQNKNTN